MDTWVVLAFWLLWIVLLWTLVYMYAFEYLFSNLLSISLRCEITRSYGNFNFLRNCQTVFHSPYTIFLELSDTGLCTYYIAVSLWSPFTFILGSPFAFLLCWTFHLLDFISSFIMVCFLFFFFNIYLIYLFICLCRVSVSAYGIFRCGARCGVQASL